MSAEQDDRFALLVEHINNLVSGAATPELPEPLQNDETVVALHTRLADLRSILTDFAKGNLSNDIRTRGYMAGTMKALQSHLRHLSWQVQQVERGDFSQRVQFLGDFSEAFNNMVKQLDSSINELKFKEEALTVLAKTLQKEVELRTAAVNALKQSETKFKYLSEHDALTEIFNRRSFHSRATAEIQRAYTMKEPCCIALLDVDFFKKFNDTYGHPEGDVALKHVVSVAKRMLRESDFIGRYGGEEFILFLGDVNGKMGLAVTERIRKSIADSPVVLADGRHVPISVSIGVAVYLAELDMPVNETMLFQHLTSVADAALYRAKKNGRNRVEMATEEELLAAPAQKERRE